MTLKTTSEDSHPELGRSQSRQETSTGWGSTLQGCLSDSPEKKRQLSFSISPFLRPDQRTGGTQVIFKELPAQERHSVEVASHPGAAVWAAVYIFTDRMGTG